MDKIDNLIKRLRQTANGELSETPWWWDCDNKRGPASILREAADTLEHLQNEGMETI